MQQKSPQFYGFDCDNGNLGVSHRVGAYREESMFRKFLRDERGATAIEYSLIAGFIALAIIYAVGMTGQRLVQLFESLITSFAH
jgi:pilus assembly protein Flp/PilA